MEEFLFQICELLHESLLESALLELQLLALPSSLHFSALEVAISTN